jgi:hypothetical protein
MHLVNIFCWIVLLWPLARAVSAEIDSLAMAQHQRAVQGGN